MKPAIYEQIKNYRGTTFVELEKIEGFEGKLIYFISNKKVNIEAFFWKMSDEAYISLGELFEENLIVATLTDKFVYVIDGGLMNEKAVGKNAKWFPIVFYTNEEAKKLNLIKSDKDIMVSDNIKKWFIIWKNDIIKEKINC